MLMSTNDIILICISILSGLVSIGFSLRFVFNVGRIKGYEEAEKELKKILQEAQNEQEWLFMEGLRQSVRNLHKELRARRTLAEQESYLKNIAREVNGLLDD